jgi:hypothetical protein
MSMIRRFFAATAALFGIHPSSFSSHGVPIPKVDIPVSATGKGYRHGSSARHDWSERLAKHRARRDIRNRIARMSRRVNRVRAIA